MAKRNRKGKAEPVASCSISGVGTEWDKIPSIRARLRDGGPLLDPETKLKREDVKVCGMNKDVLLPLVQAMHSASRHLPALNDIRDEIQAALTVNKRQSDQDVHLIEETSHQLKKYCGFVKTKVRRKEVSCVTQLKKFPQRKGVVCKTLSFIM